VGWAPAGMAPSHLSILSAPIYNGTFLVSVQNCSVLKSLCFPTCGDGGCGGKSSTRTATLRIRLRNSCGSESSTSSTTLTKRSRFIRHPWK
jgi:hypothetical protein